MDLRIQKFEDVPHQTWDSWVLALPEAGYVHSSMYLEFCHRMVGPDRAHSFALVDNHGDLMALCPLGISSMAVEDRTYSEISWNGGPVALPAVRRELPCQRRRLVADVFEILHGEAQRLGAVRCLLLRHPMLLGTLKGDARPAGQLEAFSAGYACQGQNTLIMDLSRSTEELLSGMAQEQRKRLNQSQRRGLRVKEYTGRDEGLEEMHQQYAEAHRQAAGKLTRSQESFDYMLELAEEGRLRLFVVFAEKAPAGFLYCGEFERFAFGWSQANVEEHAQEHATRHLLEWSAILSYKERNFNHYEIGRRFYGPQLHKVPSRKELSISFFKERYGGQLWPYLVFERFFDRDVCRQVYQKRLQEYLDSDLFLTQLSEAPTH